MTGSEGQQVEPLVGLDGLIRTRLRAIQAPAGLHDRVRALIAAEFRDETSSDSQWRT